MAKNLALETQSKPTRKEAPPSYPYIFRRIFLCGHPDEFIEVSRLPNHERLTHTLITWSDYEQWARERTSRQMYTLERCRRCATEYREKHCGSLEGITKRASMRSIAAYQGESVGLDQVASRMKNGFERVLTRLEKGKSGGHKIVPHARVPESEHEEDWQLIEGPGGSVYGRALRFVGRPSELQRESREVESSTSPLQMRGGGPESLNASGNLGVLQTYHQRKDSGFESHRSNVHSVNSEVQVPIEEVERQEAGGGSIFQETLSQVHDEARHCEDYLDVDPDLSLSRFSSCSSDASHKTKPWWKRAKPREDRQQGPNPQVHLLERKNTFKIWKKHSKKASTGSDETKRQPGNAHDLPCECLTTYEKSMQKSVGSFKSARRSIARFSGSSEGKASVLSHNDQRTSTTSIAEGVGSRQSFSSLDTHKCLPPLPIAQRPQYQETELSFEQDMLSNSAEFQSEGMSWDKMDDLA